MYGIVTQSTVFGRHVYAIGGNLNAARLSGVRVKMVNFWIMVNMGVLAAVAGVIYSSRTNGAQPNAGNMFELDAIAACFIGGAARQRRRRPVTGAIVGGLTMAVMSNGMQLMGVRRRPSRSSRASCSCSRSGSTSYSKRRGSAAV